MSAINPEPESKSSKEVFADFLLEIIGYERGIYRTVVDLKKQPRLVIESYLAKSNTYVSPFKILITIVTVWLLFNNFILDWYKLIGLGLDKYFEYLWLSDHDKSEAMSGVFIYYNKLMTKIIADFFSKYYMGVVILCTPLWAYLCLKLCKAYKIDFRTHLAVVGYHFSLGFIPSFIFIILLAINFWVFIIVALIIVISPLVGLRTIYNKVFVIVPVSAFFEKDGLAIEKKYYRARWIATILILITYILICWGYYSYFPFEG